MNPFPFINQTLHAEAVPIPYIVEQVGTPVYIYSASHILDTYRQFTEAFRELPHLLCYAVKANSNLAILHLLAQEGAGADIVSGGELYRALQAGIPPAKIVYSGVGKTEREIVEALRAGVYRLHIESMQEFECLQQISHALKTHVHLAPRINPDIDAHTHPYISTGVNATKFGMSAEEARTVFERSRQAAYLDVTGVSGHIGSQIITMAPFVAMVKFLAAFIEERRAEGFRIDTLDIGGGLGIAYHQEQPPT
ncbi:diaminopimelate decarboxylase, partial [candidate division KSB3 bacterium]|nr:diaminopimelate decarboxylase [candidate division KSB3 bacterium]MBD3324531.1 diaminopimelate decarboxylase [candidate division KSB3 bacterium]